MTIEIFPSTVEQRQEALAWPLWSCEPSSFEWGYDQTETCLILEGTVMLEALGKEWHFGEGDWVVLPKGLACRWNVLKTVRKHYQMG